MYTMTSCNSSWYYESRFLDAVAFYEKYLVEDADIHSAPKIYSKRQGLLVYVILSCKCISISLLVKLRRNELFQICSDFRLVLPLTPCENFIFPHSMENVKGIHYSPMQPKAARLSPRKFSALICHYTTVRTNDLRRLSLAILNKLRNSLF